MPCSSFRTSWVCIESSCDNFAAVEEVQSSSFDGIVSTVLAEAMRWVDLPRTMEGARQGFCSGFGNLFDQY